MKFIYLIITAIFTSSCGLPSDTESKLTSNTCVKYSGQCRSDWMGTLPLAVQRAPFNELLLPGTHDSAAFAINIALSSFMERTPALNTVLRLANSYFTSWLVKPFLNALTLTQRLSVFEQLEQGNRVFDFRIYYNLELNAFYLSHSFTTVSLTTVLSEMAQFMKSHPGEVILLDIQNDYEHQDSSKVYNDTALKLVRSYLGNLMLNKSADGKFDSTVTLQSLVQKQQRVVVTFSDPYTENQFNNVWPNGLIKTYWPNQTDSQDSLNRIRTDFFPQLSTAENGNFNLVFFTVTPNESVLINNLLSNITLANNPTSIRHWAAEINSPSIALIKSNLCRLPGLSIASMDYPSDDVVGAIVTLNQTPAAQRVCSE